MLMAKPEFTVATVNTLRGTVSIGRTELAYDFSGSIIFLKNSDAQFLCF